MQHTVYKILQKALGSLGKCEKAKDGNHCCICMKNRHATVIRIATWVWENLRKKTIVIQQSLLLHPEM